MLRSWLQSLSPRLLCASQNTQEFLSVTSMRWLAGGIAVQRWWQWEPVQVQWQWRRISYSMCRCGASPLRSPQIITELLFGTKACWRLIWRKKKKKKTFLNQWLQRDKVGQQALAKGQKKKILWNVLSLQKWEEIYWELCVALKSWYRAQGGSQRWKSSSW